MLLSSIDEQNIGEFNKFGDLQDLKKLREIFYFTVVKIL